MRIKFFYILFFALSFNAGAQPQWDWLRAGFSNNTAAGQAIAISPDIYKDVIVAGNYDNSTLEFVPDYPSTAVLPNTGNPTGFLTKYDSTGVHLWSFEIGNGSSNVYIRDVEVDASGNIYTLGWTDGGLDLAGTSGPPEPFVATGSGSFLAIYDRNGVHINTITINAPGNQFVEDVAVDVNGITVIGTFDTFNFGSLTLSSPGETEGFIIRYNNSYSELWRAGYLSPNGADIMSGVTSDGTNVFVNGTITNFGVVRDGLGASTGFTTSSNDILISSFDATTGGLVWTQQVSGSGYDIGAAIAVDATSIYFNGSVLGSVTIPTLGVISGIIGYGPLVAKLDKTNGTGSWAFIDNASSSGAANGATDLQVDGEGNIYTIGIYDKQIEITGTGGSSSLALPADNPGSERKNIFLSSYSDNGEFRWATKIETKKDDEGWGLAIYDNDIAISGSYDSNEANFSFHTGDSIPDSDGSISAFFARGKTSYGNSPCSDGDTDLFPKGSWIIGMDNTTQQGIDHGGTPPGYNGSGSGSGPVPFNMRAYGLANELLQNNIELYWAIKSGKAHNEADISVNAFQKFPTVGSASDLDFISGPYVIHPKDTAAARPIIEAYEALLSSQVKVYETTTDKNIEYKYKLNFKPKILVLSNGGGDKYTIHEDLLIGVAGFDASQITVTTAGAIGLSASSCYTFASEAHWKTDDGGATGVADVPTETTGVEDFVSAGGNFLSQCAGIQVYENEKHWHTTEGIYEHGHGVYGGGQKDLTHIDYNFDHPFYQINGDLVNNPTGTFVGIRPDATTGPPSVYQTDRTVFVEKDNAEKDQVAGVVKLTPDNEPGGHVFYLGGHDYRQQGGGDDRPHEIGYVNGLRMYMNAVFMPPNTQDVCAAALSFCNPCDADFAYSNDSLCANIEKESPVFLGDPSGFFEGPLGLAIKSDGDIDPSGSVPGIHTVTYYSPLGCSETYDVNIVSNDAPTFSNCGDISINIDSGTCFGTPVDTLSAYDYCGTVTITQIAGAYSLGSPMPIGVHSLSYEAEDELGQTATCNFDVTVTDNEDPIANCRPSISKNPDVNGDFTVSTGEVDLGSSDNCGTITLSLDQTAFNCSVDSNPSIVELTVEDASGNTATCNTSININDMINPVPVCQNITAYLDATGNVLVPASDVDNGSTDNCGIDFFQFQGGGNPLSRPYTCSEIGANLETIKIYDVANNWESCDVTITVLDTISPTAICHGTIARTPNTSGNFTLTTGVINNGSSDECGAVTLSLDQTLFNCSIEPNPTDVELTVTDPSGNSSTCVTTININDTTDPTPVCQNITVYLDATGFVTILPADIDGGSADNCAIDYMEIEGAPTFTFDCVDIGPNNVDLEVYDLVGNNDKCTAVVTVEDNINPIVVCPSDITQNTDLGQCDADVFGIAPGITEACDYTWKHDVSGATVRVNQNGDASGDNFNEGVSTVTYTVTDDSGNIGTCSFDITIVDNEGPNANCSNSTVQLDNNGEITIADNLTDNGSVDDCGGTLTFSVSPNYFDCSNIGSNPVVLTVTDDGGNSSTCNSNVTVEDNVDPIALCISDTTIYLDINGDATLNGIDVDNGSTDNCGIVSWTLSKTNYACGDANGTSFKTLTVKDNEGNQGQCSLPVTVLDTIMPWMPGLPSLIDTTSKENDCKQKVDWTENFDDNCGINSRYFYQTGATPKANTTYVNPGVGYAGPANKDFNVGITYVHYVIEDKKNNIDTIILPINVVDTFPPTEGLPASREIIKTTDPSTVCGETVTWNHGIDDNCAIATIIETGGTSGDFFPIDTTMIYYEATDVSGNILYDTLSIIIQDNDDPIIINLPDSLYTTDPGLCTVIPNYVLPDISDNCIVVDTTFSEHNSIPGVYPSLPTDVFPIGDNDVYITAYDAFGNSDQMHFKVKVTDEEFPTFTTFQNDTTVYVDATACDMNVFWDLPTYSDNCGVTSTNDNKSPGDNFAVDVDPYEIWFEIQDAEGNKTRDTFELMVVDTISPWLINMPADITTTTDIGICTAKITWSAPDKDDNCTGESWIDPSAWSSGDDFPVGVTPVAYSVQDASGNITRDTLFITVNDVTAPTFTPCPGNKVRNTDPGQCTDVVSAINASTNDNCSVILKTWTLSGATTGSSPATGINSASGQTFNLGVTTVTYYIEDPSGNSATCDFTVTVNDNEDPALSCPADVSASSNDDDAGDCNTIVNGIDPVVSSDNCIKSFQTWTLSGATTGSSPASGFNVASGQEFNVGVTTVTYYVEDASGNNNTCNFNVTVIDNEAPKITCPSNISQNADPGACTSSITVPDPVYGDNCNVNSVTWSATGATILSSPATGINFVGTQSFNVGTTSVMYFVIDDAGNDTQCSFDVVVSDTEFPTITCPGDVTQNTAAGTCKASVGSLSAVVADNCGIASLTWVMTGATIDSGINDVSGETFLLGTTTVKYTVTDDSGNVTSCEFDVTVEDNELPQINCASDKIQDTDAGNCTAVGTGLAPTLTSDNCSYTVTYIISGATTGSGTNDASGTTFNLGISDIVYTITDGSGNIATCTTQIEVQDVEDPVITCPSNQTVSADASTCTANVTVAPPVYSDNCSVASVVNDFNNSGNASGNYPLGTTTVIWTITDGTGNTTICSHDITVEDNEDPSIFCAADQNQAPDPGMCTATVTVNPPLVMENCSGSVVTNDFNGTADASGTYPLGTTTIEWTVTDGSGNTATCTQDITILDTIDPSITCPGNVSQDADGSVCNAVVNSIDPTASDNCAIVLQTWTLSGATIASSPLTGINSASGETFELGVTNVAYYVEDAAGNSANCSFTVTISDNENPTISCPADVTANTSDDGLGDCSSTVSIPSPVTSDNCGIVSQTWTLSGATTDSGSNDVSGETFNQGITTVTYTVQDASSNSATCSFTVTVTDDEDPTILCGSDITQNNDPGLCNAFVTVNSPLTLDNCSVTLSNNFNGTSNASDTYPIGTTTVIWTATDVQGNSVICNQDITVSDNEDPSITCPGDQVVPVNPGFCVAAVTVPAPITNDNCTVVSVTNDVNGTSNASGFYNVGTTTVTWTVTDNSGNTSFCSHDITVVDNIDPTIFCSADKTQTVDPGSCDAAVTVAPPSTGDNCSVASVTNDFNGTSDASDTYPVGITTVTWTVLDASGNSATCSQDITVNDNEDPTLTCAANQTQTADAGNCTAAVTVIAPTPADNCSVVSVINDFNGTSDASDTYPLGTTTIIWTVTDGSGNTGTCTQDITVTDDEDPSITCAADQLQAADPGVCTGTVTVIAPLTGDNCSVASVINDFNGTADASDVYPSGTTTITWTVTDGSGNTNSCTQDITISDTENPTITCAANQSQTADAGSCVAAITVIAPTPADNCSVASVINDFNGTSDASDTYPLGTTVVTWTVTDAAGNTTTCTQNITVTDNENPTITCPADQTVNADPSTCTALLAILSPATSDNCSVASVINDFNGTSDASDTYPLGTTTITWTVTDGSGNTGTCSQDITVTDIQPTLTIDDITVDEGDGTATFNLELSHAYCQDVIVTYESGDVTAIGGDDFTSISSGTTITITSGTTSGIINVSITDDIITESTETYEINISGVTNVSGYDAQGIGTITDNELPPTVNIDNVTVDEADGIATFTLSLSHPSSSSTSIDWATSDGTASDGFDYNSDGNTMVFAPFELTQNISITILEDSFDEFDETFNITLSNPMGLTIGTGTGISTITDNDDPPVINFGNISVNENAGSSSLGFSLSAQSSFDVTFDYVTSTGTADGSDFVEQLTPITLTIPAYTSDVYISTNITNDNIYESFEEFYIDLSNANNASLSGTQATVTIIDDEVEPIISVSDISVNEGAGSVSVTLSLDHPSVFTVTYDWMTATGSASSLDFVEQSSFIGGPTFAPGTTSQTVNIGITEDAISETTETFDLIIANAINASIVDNNGTISIVDNDGLPTIGIDNVTIDEGSGPAILTVALSNVAATDVTVDYVTVENSATGDVDYSEQLTPTQITITAGTLSSSISVPLIDDLISESNETFDIQLSNPIGATFNDDLGIVTITDNDGTPDLTIGDVSVDEAIGNATVVVTMSNPSAVDVTFNYITTTGTASGLDFTDLTSPTNVTIVAGNTFANLSVPINDDNISEASESFTVDLSNPIGASNSDNQAIVTITDNDGTPDLTIADISVDEAVGTATLIVTMTNPSAVDVTFDYVTTTGTASGLDYTEVTIPTTVTISAGSTSANILVAINDDNISEVSEDFTVDLSNPIGATNSDNQALVTITDNDGTPDLTIADLSVDEGDGTASVVVTMSNPSAIDVTFDYVTTTGTASGLDFTEVTTLSNVTISAGNTSANIVIAINDDNISETSEDFTVDLSNPIGATNSDNQALVTITDNDGTPDLTIADLSVDEGDGTASVVVTMSNPSATDVTFDYVTTTGAASGLDFTEVTAAIAVTIAAGSTSANIVIAINDDNISEASEDFTVDLSNEVGATISDATATVTITDNDGTPDLTIADISVDEAVGTATLIVTMTNPSAVDVTFDYVTTTGTASGLDFTEVTAATAVTIAAGSTTANIVIAINDDNISEASESFTVDLSNPIGASNSDNQAIVTITDNDGTPDLTIADISVDEAVGTATLIVTMTNPSAVDVTFDYVTTTGTASGLDYTEVTIPTTVTISAGSTSANILVAINDDNISEASEDFTVDLSNPIGATNSDNQALVTITDNDGTPDLTIADLSVDEGDGTATIVVTMSNPSATNVTFDYVTTTGTASGLDFTEVTAATAVNITAGSTTANIVIAINDDNISEASEDFTVDLSNEVGATISDATATVTITDNDGTPDLTIADLSVDEGDGTATIVVTMSNPSATNVTFDYVTTTGTASGLDFTEVTAATAVTITAGSTTANIVIAINDDNISEASEDFTVDLSNEVGATISDATATVTITDNDGTTNLTIADITVDEGDGTATLVVTMSNPSATDVTFDYVTTTGTASASDFTEVTSATSVTINAGNTNANIIISINDDILSETSEDFTVDLSNSVGANISDNQATITITDNDATPCLSIDDITQDESLANMTFTIALNAVSGQEVTVEYDVTEITATNGGTDFTASATTVVVTIPEGTLSVPVIVPINDDALNEIDETFEITLSDPTAATLCVGLDVGTGTITDNDAIPCLSITNETELESAGTMTFTISLDAVSGQDVTVDYDVTDLTAVNGGTDFTTAASGTLTILEGATTASISVSINDDALNEIDETFEIALSNPSASATLCVGNDVGTGTITDNDAAPCLSIADATEDESIGNMVFNVTLSAPSGQPVDFTYTLADVTTNTLATDYTNAPIVVTMPAGATTATISIPINDDLLDEIDETFTVTLTGNVNADLCVGSETATGTITDNDATPCVSIDDVTVTEADGVATFTVTLDAASGQDVIVDYAFADVTTGSNAVIDASIAATQVTINEGDLTATFDVTINEDLLDEIDETYTITLGTIVNGTVCPAMGVGTGTITDNDEPPCIGIDDITLVENAGSMVFTLSLDVPSGQDVSVDYNIIDASATNGGVDFTAASNGTITISEGSTTGIISVTLNDDILFEGTETFDIVLDPPTAATLCAGAEIGTGSILDDEGAPTLNVNDTTYNETDGSVTFTVFSTGISATDITFDVVSIDGTAIGGTDFDAISVLPATIPAGSNNYDVVFNIIDDGLFEFDETFTIQVSNISGATMADPEAEITISSEDIEPCIAISSESLLENASWMDFDISLDAISGEDVTVDLTVTNITTNTSDPDYNGGAIPSSITIPAGSTNYTLSVFISDDLLDEIDETFEITLSNPISASLCPGLEIGTGTILDNDNPPCISANDISVNEADGTASFEVTLDAVSGQTISVDYFLADGSAVQGDDYTYSTNSLVFTEGMTSISVVVPIIEDALSELNETFTLNLLNEINATLCTSLATATIVDNDPLPELSIDNVTANEAAGTMTFTITLSAVSGQDVFVDYAINDLSAINGGVDFTGSTPGNLIIPAGNISTTITVTINDDVLNESDETFEIALSNEIGATIDITGGIGTGTIQDNDALPCLDVQIVTPINESAGTVSIEISLDNPSGQDVSFNYNQTDNTALDSFDYTLTFGSATIIAGNSNTFINVPILEDALDEFDEEFLFNIFGASNANICTNQQSISIIDNDNPPCVSINDVSVLEGTGIASFDVCLDAPSGKDITVNYTLNDITTGTGGNVDASIGATSIVIPAGSTCGTINVTIITDALNELDETYEIIFGTVVNGTICDGTGTGTIVNDDVFPCLSISSESEFETIGNMPFTVSLDTPSGQSVNVDYSFSDITATNGVDYTGILSSLNFAEGEVSKTILVPINDDFTNELDETFEITLTNETNATLCNATGVGEILDNDVFPCLSADLSIIVDEGVGLANIIVSLDVTSALDVTFSYNTSDITANTPQDYTLTVGTATISAGDISTTISVPIFDDLLNELSETFQFDIHTPINAGICTGSGVTTITISDNDNAPNLCINATDSLLESDGSVSIEVTLSEISALPVTVDYFTTDGSATATDDYNPLGGTISFAPGENSKIISIDIVDDTQDEIYEDFIVTLTNPTNANIPAGCEMNTTTIEDNDAPIAQCAPFNAYLDAAGMVSIEHDDVDNNSNEFGTIVSYSTSDTSFTCADMPNVSVDLTVVDINGQSGSCAAIVSVIDTIVPTLSCNDTIIALNNLGTVSINAIDLIDSDFSDNCAAFPPYFYSIAEDGAFDCSNIGAQVVEVAITDGSGNVSVCSSNVTVVDTIAPIITCPVDVLLETDPGMNTASYSYAPPGVVENCVDSIVQTDISGYTNGSNFPIGTTIQEFTVYSASGDEATCSFIIEVEDNEAPVANCHPDFDLDLDNLGNASITISDINNSSSDNDGIASITISQDEFDCSDIGPNEIWLVVEDNSGNMDSCMTVVTVFDVTPPVISCIGNLNLALDSTGILALTPALFDTGTMDVCDGIDLDLSLDVDTFYCDDIGTVNVTMYAIDQSNNIDSCIIALSIYDDIAPEALCLGNLTVQLDAAGSATITSADIDAGTNDNCDFTSTLSLDTFDCSMIGDTLITMTVTDSTGNSNSCATLITVEDAIDPVLTCPADIDTVAELGMCSVDLILDPLLVMENCTYTISNDFTSGEEDASGTYPVGITTIEYTVIDQGGNEVTCTTAISVEDNQLPVIECPSDTIINTESGESYAIFEYTDPNYSDNCSGATLSLEEGIASGEEFPIGENSIVYVVIDASGNTDTCHYYVTVVDDEYPTIEAEDVVSCEGFVNVPLPIVTDNSDDIVMVSNDFTGTEDASSSDYEPGTTMVIWTVMDGAGLTATDTSYVEVWAEPIAPDAGEDQNLFFQHSTFLEGNEININYTYWEFLDGAGVILNDSIHNTEVTDLDFGTHILTWTVDNGVCPVQQDTMVIQVDKIEVPNAISPDGDGLNDKLVIEGITNFENQVIVYNRWGKIMYQSNDYQNDWEALNTNGQKLPPDTYFYIVNIKGVQEYSGFLVVKY